jgi:hypothetical protein
LHRAWTRLNTPLDAPVKTDAPMVTTLAAIFVSRWRQTTSGSLVVSRVPGWHCPILIGAGRCSNDI